MPPFGVGNQRHFLLSTMLLSDLSAHASIQNERIKKLLHMLLVLQPSGRHSETTVAGNP